MVEVRFGFQQGVIRNDGSDGLHVGMAGNYKKSEKTENRAPRKTFTCIIAVIKITDGKL